MLQTVISQLFGIVKPIKCGLASECNSFMGSFLAPVVVEILSSAEFFQD